MAIKISEMTSLPDNNQPSDLFEMSRETSPGVFTTYKTTVAQLNAGSGNISIVGTWDAAANIPPLVSSVGNPWEGYEVTTSGNTILDGIGAWNIGDVVLFDGNSNTWKRPFNLNYVPPLRVLGIWDAASNITEFADGQLGPPLVSGIGEPWGGYGVAVAGNTNLDGNTNWNVGDFVVFNQFTNMWGKLLVTYINGKSGNVTLTASDIPVNYTSTNYPLDTYQALISDTIIGSQYAGMSSPNLLLPDETQLVTAKFLWIRDEVGNTGISGITAQSTTGKNINGALTYAMTTTKGFWQFYWNGIEWFASEIDQSSNTLPNFANTAIPYGDADNIHLTSDSSRINFDPTLVSFNFGIGNTNLGTNSAISGGGGNSINANVDKGQIINSTNCSIDDCPIGPNGILSSFSSHLNNCANSLISGGSNHSITNATFSFIANGDSNTILHDGVGIITDSNTTPYTSVKKDYLYFNFKNGIGFGRTPTADVDIAGSMNVGYVKINPLFPTSYTATIHDYIIGVAYTGVSSPSIVLPTAITIAGRPLIIKDEVNTALLHPITIQGDSGQKFNGGGTTITINTNGGSFMFYSDGSNWFTY